MNGSPAPTSETWQQGVNPGNLYAEPTKLISLITKKVEPQPKVYMNQSQVMLQH